ncbi:MAG: ankyrin repeat domain-containing protein [Candidatus Amoebophilus sp.]
MKNNYTLKPQLFSFILLINLFLQGCKHSPHLPTPTKEEAKGHLQIDIKKLTGNKFLSKEGYSITFYQQQGVLQAGLKEGHGCMHRIHNLPVYVEHGKTIEQLLHFVQKGNKGLIHIIIPEGKIPSFVYLGESGLMGGSNTGRDKGKEKLTEDEQPQGIIDINDSEGYQQLLALAIEGEAEAQFLLGLRAYSLWKRGERQEEAYQEAINWFEKAAIQGHQAAIVLLQELRISTCSENITSSTTKQFIFPVRQMNHLVNSSQKDKQQEEKDLLSQELKELFQKGKSAYRAWRKFKSDIDCQAAIQSLQEADKKGYEPASKLLKRLQSKLQQYQKSESPNRLHLHTIYPQSGSSSEISIAGRLGKENLAGLPINIWAHILSYLSHSKELIAAKQVNSIFDELIEGILSNRLQEAIIMADEAQVREVIKAGVNTHIEDENGMTPLYVAADKGQLEIAKLLLRAQQGSSIEGIAEFDSKASEETIKNMAESLIESVLQLKFKNKYINTSDEAGNTPLHLAAEKGQLGLVNLFLKHGRAGMYTQNYNGQLPLHLAAQEGHTAIVALLSSVYAIDNNGQTPLHLAAHKGHLEVARVLIAKGAHINVQDINRKTPLQLAILNNHAALEKFLLAKSKKPNNKNTYGFYRG